MPDITASDDSLKNAMENLSDQARKLEIANFYTHGGMENAKKMVAGSYKDLYVIKGKFSSSSVYGAFIIFINSVYMSVANFYGIVSRSFTVHDIDTTRDWRAFETEIHKILALGEHDDVIGNHMRDVMTAGITMQFITNLKKLLEQNDQIAINHHFQKFTQDRLGFQNIKVSVDHNQASSLDMELNSVSSRKLSEKDLKGSGGEEDADPYEDIKALDDENELLEGKEVKLIFNGSLILAPVKGKDISTLIVGDRVKIKIVDRTPKAVSLAKAFKAWEDGQMLPIAGRVVTVKKSPQGGYKIFVIVAKGIFIRIDEEEDRIKILMDDTGSPQAGRDAAGHTVNIPVVILLVLVFFALVGAIIFFLR